MDLFQFFEDKNCNKVTAASIWCKYNIKNMNIFVENTRDGPWTEHTFDAQ